MLLNRCCWEYKFVLINYNLVDLVNCILNDLSIQLLENLATINDCGTPYFFNSSSLLIYQKIIKKQMFPYQYYKLDS